ncbi:MULTISPECIES: flavin reductase family protein [unclassified Leeuwenhoekiella]|uniref:flavin reductase family protein n=1 Tax=unclassified Leeuwenhoekiella TaxID=2615029 RepID=UPI000C423D4B|nr:MULTISPECIES: flavin reductase family protein [unclassified Leeuwenhoekiella]MAW96796.1 flavin reductase [Leeuwenhoekiella sp.]MBA82391.1 flavin reductase [Leeuwenhoekiella sp.]|tara:strand:+ start:13856 stop:14737 length:882 start_codon:yes stop_codon:yes gene_type:complete
MQFKTQTLDPAASDNATVYGILAGAVSPRPIAFASTLDAQGKPNLAPYSFFNVFSSNPPIVVFSPVRRGRDNTTKHTLDNILETKEVVINIVNYAMVQQMSLASTEYDAGVDEFIKAGFTKVESEAVKPFRVKESPVQLECKVKEVVAMGDDGGAGNLVICEVLRMHLHEEILDEAGRIDDHKIDLVARMGGNWYTRAIDGMFEVPKPLRNLGVGVDQIPEAFRNSSILTGNDLGRLGNVDVLPQAEEIRAYLSEDEQLQHLATDKDNPDLHLRIKELISNNKILEAWKLILA